MKINWGILATGRIAHAFADAAEASAHASLGAIASRSPAGAARIAADYPEATTYDNYQALLEDPQIDAVYIATPHTFHAQWTIRALQAGKRVLCEKPLGLNHPEVMTMIDAAQQADCFLMEAFMYRCHPQTIEMMSLIKDGAIGEVRHIQASFGYHARFNENSRLFANDLGGGGILDVGCYPMSAARLIAGAEPQQITANGRLGSTGVDEFSAALAHFDNGISAQLATSISVGLDNQLNIYGSKGRISLANPWLCADEQGNWGFELQRAGHDAEQISGQAAPIYVLEIDHVAECIERGETSSKLMSWTDSQANALALDAWRAAIGLEYEKEQPASHSGPLLGSLATPQQPLPSGSIAHLQKAVSKLVMGCDNQPGMSHAAVMWDNFFESGGNCFDTAHLYGGGAMEKLLGHWQQQRNLRNQLVIIGKGAHTPHNFPDRISPQLDESLERLQTDYVDVYFLHRDNLQVAAGEFVDALNEEVARGRISAFGGSNWTLERIREANDYAARNNLQGFSAVSNNFSLAQMVTPIWQGVETATSLEFKEYLSTNEIALMPWSSQARGFFTPWAGRVIAADEQENQTITTMQPTVSELKRVWFSADNLLRRERAQQLAQRRGVDMIEIALAYVLNQPFPCFPLIGPRQIRETRSSIAALQIDLSPAELAWLNLEDESASG